jgi:hypothetical protein
MGFLQLTLREVVAAWMAFLAFNLSSSTYAEYLLTYVCGGGFGAGETASGFMTRIPRVTTRTERNGWHHQPTSGNCVLPSLSSLTTFHLMVIWAYRAMLVSQGFLARRRITMWPTRGAQGIQLQSASRS